MTPIRQQSIRELLRQHTDGLTAQQIEAKLNLRASDVRRCLKVMPDVFVDRWSKGKRGQYEAVWCAIRVPADCPHPRDRAFKYVPPRTVWQPIGAHA